jgi:4-hydroxythreonine-4-phosphate dehydrogenase
MLVTTEAVLGTILTVAEGMSAYFGLRGVRIGVCGLNPHAGEGGLFGREDDSVIGPAIEAASKKGVDCSGPFPADTLFVRALKGEFDVVVSMYHDQGLPPVKVVAMGSSANVTLGLPIVRTSVDHGTAFDIAGNGVADPSSMIFAIKTAYEMSCASAELF